MNNLGTDGLIDSCSERPPSVFSQSCILLSLQGKDGWLSCVCIHVSLHFIFYFKFCEEFLGNKLNIIKCYFILVQWQTICK